MNINNCNFYSDDNNQISSVVSWGNRLRQVRESMGLSQKKIASSLCLKLSIIKNIEEGKLDKLEISSIFLYGYIRSYARLLGISSEEIMPPILPELNPVSSIHNTTRLAIFRFWKRYTEKMKLLVILCSTFCFFIIILLIVWYLKFFSAQKCDFNTDCLKPISFFSNNEVNKYRLIIFSNKNIWNQFPNIFLNSVFDTAGTGYADRFIFCFSEVFNKLLKDTEGYNLYENIVFYTFDNVNTMNYSVYNLNDSDNMLVMNFMSDCWVEVFDATGKRLYVGTQYSGNILNLHGKIPYRLIIGAPQSVEIRYKGNIVNLEPFVSPYKVARITIPNQQIDE